MRETVELASPILQKLPTGTRALRHLGKLGEEVVEQRGRRLGSVKSHAPSDRPPAFGKVGEVRVARQHGRRDIPVRDLGPMRMELRRDCAPDMRRVQVERYDVKANAAPTTSQDGHTARLDNAVMDWNRAWNSGRVTKTKPLASALSPKEDEIDALRQ